MSYVWVVVTKTTLPYGHCVLATLPCRQLQNMPLNPTHLLHMPLHISVSPTYLHSPLQILIYTTEGALSASLTAALAAKCLADALGALETFVMRMNKCNSASRMSALHSFLRSW